MKYFLFNLCLLLTFFSNAQYRTVTVESSDEKIYDPFFVINFDEQSHYALSRNDGKVHLSLDSGKTWKMTSLFFEDYKDCNFFKTTLVSTKKGKFVAISLVSLEGNSDPNAIASHVWDNKKEVWEENDPSFIQETGKIAGLEANYDFNTNNIYASWQSVRDDGEKVQYLAVSGNEGKRWSDPVKINSREESTSTTMSNPRVINSFDGKVLVTWSTEDNFFIDRSYDKGKMWLRSDINILNRSTGLYFEYPGIGKLSAAPNTASDLSLSPLRGNVYLVWTDLMDNVPTLLMVKTGNDGDTWTQPSEIIDSDDEYIRYQPNIKVDKGTGIVYVSYLGRKPGEEKSDIFLAFSRTGGTRYKEFKVTQDPIKHSEIKNNEQIIHLDVLYGIISISYLVENQGKYELRNTIITKDEIDY